jgi:hypothetical protein
VNGKAKCDTLRWNGRKNQHLEEHYAGVPSRIGTWVSLKQACLSELGALV